MRPQDIAILLKLISIDNQNWILTTLSSEIKISISEISESLNRSRIASLIDHNKKMVNRGNFLEFLEHGIKFVFPQTPGTLVRGIPTAHSHPLMKNIFLSTIDYVWPDKNGSLIGLEIEPFYKKQTEAVLIDQKYYELLSLTDMLRVGKLREQKYAITELKKNFKR